MLEQLALGNTVIHRLHPMVKLLTTVFFIITVVSVNRYSLSELIAFLFYPFILMAVSETPHLFLLKQFIIVLPFSVLAGISNLIFDTGTAFFIGNIGVSCGMLSFCTILIKTYLTVMAVLILVSTTPLQDLSHQMVRIRVPAIIVMVFTMTYRYMGILLQEASRMHTAYLLHSPSDKGIKMQHMGSFVGQLLLRSIDRAERVYYAMKCRGYQGAVGYAKKRTIPLTDWVYGISVCSVCLVLRFVNLVDLLGNLVL